jgi:uncharacterized protein (DUF983 family)
MFRAWLKLQTKCPLCALNYNFAAPDDGPAFFSLCMSHSHSHFSWSGSGDLRSTLWVHFLTSFPLVVIGCILPLQYIKGWLVASQYVNHAQEAGTEKLWADLHARAESRATDMDGTSTPGQAFQRPRACCGHLRPSTDLILPA